MKSAYLIGSIALCAAVGLAACRQPEQSEVDMALVQACAECHGEGGAAIPGWPPLQSMTEAEIVAKLKGHRARVVADSTMARVAHNLTDEQIEQLAAHFAGRN